MNRTHLSNTVWNCLIVLFNLAVILIPASPVPAQNLINNPGAESGDFTGWMRGGTPANDPTIDPSTHIPNPPNHSGNHRVGISVGWNTADCYQYQTVSVTPGAEYALALWYVKEDGTDESLTVSWANGSFGAPEEVLYNVGGSVRQSSWAQLNGARFIPSQDTVTIIIHYRHTYATNIASIHVDDINFVYYGPGPTPTFGPSLTPTQTPGPTRTPTPTMNPSVTPIPMQNREFEGNFTNGVADGWTSFRIQGGGFWKSNELLGRLGGGIYGCTTGSGIPGYDCIDEYQSARMSAKTYAVEQSRYDLVGLFENVLGQEVLTLAKIGPEAHLDVFPDGDTWENNAESDGRRFADYVVDQWINKNPGFQADVYHGLNEPSTNVASDLAKVCRFELGFTRRMHERGYRTCVINASVGTPSPLENALIPEFRELMAEADYLGYHAYGNWNTGWMCPADADPWTYRWQQVIDWYTERGWRHPPVLYTEGGQYWWIGEKTPQQIIADLNCYESRERQEEFWSVGLHYFVTGAWPGGWQEMNLSLYPEIIDACSQTNRAHPNDAHGGLRSQEMGGRKEIYDIGIRQQITTIPGWDYELRGWFKYEYEEGWPNQSTIQVGWDPTGQTASPTAASVQWSSNLITLGYNNPIYDGPWETDIWYEYRGTFHATGATTSLWIRTTEPTGSTTARAYVDDISIWPLEAGSGKAHMNAY